MQDLWMLLSGARDEMRAQLSHVLQGYGAFMDFDARELTLIEPLRTLRLIHYSAWIARRWDDPAFPINFLWFGSRDYWQGQVDMQYRVLDIMGKKHTSTVDIYYTGKKKKRVKCLCKPFETTKLSD